MLCALVLIGPTFQFLTGCATSYPTNYRMECATPPGEILQPCEVEAYTIKTNGDLLFAFIRTRSALLRCADKVEALREWANAVNNE